MSNDTSGRNLGGQPGSPATTPDRAGNQPEAGTREGEGGMDRSLQQAVREDLDELRQFADERTEEAKEAVSRAAEDEKNVAARQLGGIATALEKVGGELEQSDQRALGRYAKQMGSSLQDLARDIEGRELGEIAAMAEDFGRKQPLAFLGMAAIAGLAASRFLTASAHRRSRRSVSQPSSPTPSGSSRPSEGGWNFTEDRRNA
ncbi:MULTISPECIES: nutrient deprivation-induced protein [Sinorhizobium]|uniref:nutrient deprivation-induced protein n=1 Tax=Sinorhizobium TaxID=28105 RepID=UPI000BE8612A|nr:MULTISPECIES: nutrient deprivation-induced protein [Sinorhizobium]PDT53197.1 nutrient deprivation-induced protein [Sinorhizobium sp. NG07B]POH29365.1 nutrient deprivation-induced protein [Sinorhizobium americanum]